jgi:hypothetical protein
VAVVNCQHQQINQEIKIISKNLLDLFLEKALFSNFLWNFLSIVLRIWWIEVAVLNGQHNHPTFTKINSRNY